MNQHHIETNNSVHIMQNDNLTVKAEYPIEDCELEYPLCVFEDNKTGYHITIASDLELNDPLIFEQFATRLIAEYTKHKMTMLPDNWWMTVLADLLSPQVR